MRIIITILILVMIGAPSNLFSSQKIENGVIYGRVSSAMYDPLEGVEISVFRAGEENTIQATRSNDKGEYELKQLATGTYTVTFSLRGFKLRRIEELYLSAPHKYLLDTGLEVGMNNDIPQSVIIGKVQQPNLSPVSNATVTMIEAASAKLVRQVRTGKNGDFKITINSRPGQYVLYASSQAYLTSAQGIVIKTTDQQTVNLRLTLSSNN